MKKIDIGFISSFRTKNVKYGAYSSVLIAVVVAIAVVVNLVFSQLPAKLTSFDLSPDNLYSIGSETENLLENLDKDVNITVLSAEDDADTTIAKLLENYEASKHITVKYADPTKDVGLANTYSGYTSNSLVVTCDTKETVIDYYSIYVSDYSSYYTTGSVSTTFDGEGQITSAIAYVTSDSSENLYYVVGHGESTMSSTVNSLVEKQNITANELNLMTAGSIPEDCDALLIYAPTTDYSADEAQMIIDYMDNGGSVIVLTTYTEENMPNFGSILSAYGITVDDGIVMESSSNYYQYPMYIIPDIESSDLTDDLASENANILIPSAQGLLTTDVDGVELTELLASSDGAYAKAVVDGQISTYEKESGDLDGPFGYAYLAEKTITKTTTDSDDTDEEDAEAGEGTDTDAYADGEGTIAEETADETADADTDEENSEAADDSDEDSDDENADTDSDEDSDSETEELTGRLIVVSAASLLDDSITQSLPVSNLDFFMNCVSYLCGDDGTVSNVSIEAKSMDATSIIVSSSQIAIWMFVTIILIPLGVFIAGIAVWFKRRKR